MLDKGFIKRVHEAIDNCLKIKICILCGKDVFPDTEFRDEVSRQEWLISSTCQACQDAIFQEEEES